MKFYFSRCVRMHVFHYVPVSAVRSVAAAPRVDPSTSSARRKWTAPSTRNHIFGRSPVTRQQRRIDQTSQYDRSFVFVAFQKEK